MKDEWINCRDGNRIGCIYESQSERVESTAQNVAEHIGVSRKEASPEIDTYWSRTNRDREKIFEIFQIIKKQEKLPFEDQAKRLQQIRKDRNFTAKQFAEELSSPFGMEPLPEEDIKFTEKKIYDLEYGKIKIGQQMAVLVFQKFGVSGAWLLTVRAPAYPH